MEFLEEETRPRFLFHSRASTASPVESEPRKINKQLVFVCASLSVSLSLFSFFFVQSETLRFLLIWFSLSFLLGPFAPISITGGDIRVGGGKLLEPPDLDQTAQLEDPKKRLPNRRQKTRKPEDPATPLIANSTVGDNGSVHNSEESRRKSENLVCNGDGSLEFEEKEWTDEDFDLLKKQILKHPVGESGRWELIAEAFFGRHKMDSVIKMGKSMGEKRPKVGDSFSQFLKQRKPLDKRLEGSNEVVDDGQDVKKESNWSSGEDIALLNALKAFPKDVSMRWDKIAAAVPGKSKADCMKRIAELKRDFRNSKVSPDS